MPEFLLEDMIEFLVFFVTHPELVPDTIDMSEFVTFATMFISSPDYIRNPFIRGTFHVCCHEYWA